MTILRISFLLLMDVETYRPLETNRASAGSEKETPRRAPRRSVRGSEARTEVCSQLSRHGCVQRACDAVLRRERSRTGSDPNNVGERTKPGAILLVWRQESIRREMWPVR